MSCGYLISYAFLLKVVSGIQSQLDGPDNAAAYIIGYSGIPVKEDFIFFKVAFKGAQDRVNIPSSR